MTGHRVWLRMTLAFAPDCVPRTGLRPAAEFEAGGIDSFPAMFSDPSGLEILRSGGRLTAGTTLCQRVATLSSPLSYPRLCPRPSRATPEFPRPFPSEAPHPRKHKSIPSNLGASPGFFCSSSIPLPTRCGSWREERSDVWFEAEAFPVWFWAFPFPEPEGCKAYRKQTRVVPCSVRPYGESG